MEDLRAIINQALDRLQSEFDSDLQGVLVGGSRLRCEGDPHSDIDVIAVIGRPSRKRWNFVIDGIEIETLINPAFQIRRYFKDEWKSGRGVMPHLISTGRVVFDPGGLMTELQEEARAIWSTGPSPLSDLERWQFRYFTADALRDLADVRANGSDERVVYLIGLTVTMVLSQHYRISGRWLPKPKKLFNDLEQWDKYAASLARLACADVRLSERGSAVEELATHILSPIGGPMPLDWHTEWDHLTPDA